MSMRQPFTLIEHARARENSMPDTNWRPQTEDGFQDLYAMQKGCWGKLGHEPSH